jgi:hypothetical protein
MPAGRWHARNSKFHNNSNLTLALRLGFAQDLEESDDSENELKKLDSNASGEAEKKKKKKRRKKPKKRDDAGEGSEVRDRCRMCL